MDRASHLTVVLVFSGQASVHQWCVHEMRVYRIRRNPTRSEFNSQGSSEGGQVRVHQLFLCCAIFSATNFYLIRKPMHFFLNSCCEFFSYTEKLHQEILVFRVDNLTDGAFLFPSWKEKYNAMLIACIIFLQVLQEYVEIRLILSSVVIVLDWTGTKPLSPSSHIFVNLVYILNSWKLASLFFFCLFTWTKITIIIKIYQRTV